MNNDGLSKDEKEILKKHKELELQGKEKESQFWIEVYPNYSIDSKIEYWLSNIHHGMRIQGEANGDPYTEFSIEWYEDVKSKESDFDLIFREVVFMMSMDFNWNEYYKRINKVFN